MLLQIRSQGFPNLISELGIQSPLQGPFWGFESTVIPIIDVRGARNLPRSGVVYDGFASAGQIGQPGANTFLAQTNNLFKRGAWAIYLSWAWINVEATNSILLFRRYNDAFTVVLEQEHLDIFGGTAIGEKRLGGGHREMVIQKNNFGEPWALVLQQAMPTAGSIAEGVIRVRYLGDVEGPSGF
jgi:hypothetical protein